MRRSLALLALTGLLAASACDRGGPSSAPPTVAPEAQARVDSGAGPAPQPDCPPSQIGEIDGTCRPWVLSRRVREHVQGHTATLLADGRVLVVGGERRGRLLGLSALYDPPADAWDTATHLPNPRSEHTATLLPDGRVLVVGGRGRSGVLGSALLFDLATSEWTRAGAVPPGPMPAGRAAHAAVALGDGRVLVAGGRTGTGTVTGASALFDPASGSWSEAGEMAFERYRHTLTRLPDGSVLAIGGSPTPRDDEHAHAPEAWASVERYDPSADRWSPAPTMHHERTGHAAVALSDGSVLVVGGLWDPARPAEMLVYGSDAWTEVGGLRPGRNDVAPVRIGPAVGVIGGYTPGRDVLGAVEAWREQSFEALGVLGTARGRHHAVVVEADERVWRLLLVGGRWSGPDGATSLIDLAVDAGGDVALRQLGPAALAQAPWPRGADAAEPTDLTDPVSVVVPEAAGDWAGSIVVADGGHVTDRLWALEPGTGELSRLPYLPQPVSGAAVGWLVGPGGSAALAVVGGERPVAGSLTGEIEREPTGALWKLAPGPAGPERRWVPGPPLPEPLGPAVAASRSDGGLVVAGLRSGDETSASAVLEPGSTSWRRLEGWPEALVDLSLHRLADGRLVGCGAVEGALGSTCLMLDIGAESWAPLPALRSPRRGFTVSAPTAETLLAIGGETPEGEPLRVVEQLESSSGAWRAVASLPDDRSDHAAITLDDGRVVVIGGRDKTGPVATTVVWWPEEATWAPGPPLSAARARHDALVQPGGDLVVVGGESDAPTLFEMLWLE